MSRLQQSPLAIQHYDIHRIVLTGPCVPVIGLPISHNQANPNCDLASRGHCDHHPHQTARHHG